jgi:hypothetical protein
MRIPIITNKVDDMNWKEFLNPTVGKILLTIFFLLVPIPLPTSYQLILSARYSPLLSIPFLLNSTSIAYFSVALIAIEFYLLASLVSNFYHKFVLKDTALKM